MAGYDLRTMPVCICLDCRPQGAFTRKLLQEGHIMGEIVEIDEDPCQVGLPQVQSVEGFF